MLYKKKKHQTLNYFVNDVNNQYNNLYNIYFFPFQGIEMLNQCKIKYSRAITWKNCIFS